MFARVLLPVVRFNEMLRPNVMFSLFLFLQRLSTFSDMPWCSRVILSAETVLFFNPNATTATDNDRVLGNVRIGQRCSDCMRDAG